MVFEEWLHRNHVQLSISITRTIGPPLRPWRCEISGFSDADYATMRPAVFLQDANGRLNDVVAFAATPGDAYLIAVAKLDGLRVNVILRERNETLTLPEGLTV